MKRKACDNLRMVTEILWIKMDMDKVSRWAYLLFVLIAVVMGLVVGYMAWAEGSWSAVSDINGWVLLIMLVLGVIIGLTSLTAREVTPFLIATIALVVAASANVWSPLDQIHSLLDFWATGILNYIVEFAAPAAVIVAIKSVITIAKD